MLVSHILKNKDENCFQGSDASMKSMEKIDKFPGIKKNGKWKIKYGKIFMFPDYYHCSKILLSKIENEVFPKII